MITIRVLDEAGTFAEDKDIAAALRQQKLKPALDRGSKVRIDFTGVNGATQSFVHALISELIRSMGPAVLSKVEFRKCNPTVRSVVEIVVEYSQLEEGDEITKSAARSVAKVDNNGRQEGRRR